MSGLPNRWLGQLAITIPATVLVLVALPFGTGATATGNLIVFSLLTTPAGVLSLVFAVAIVTVGMIAWAPYHIERQLTPGSLPDSWYYLAAARGLLLGACHD